MFSLAMRYRFAYDALVSTLHLPVIWVSNEITQSAQSADNTGPGPESQSSQDPI